MWLSKKHTRILENSTGVQQWGFWRWKQRAGEPSRLWAAFLQCSRSKRWRHSSVISQRFSPSGTWTWTETTLRQSRCTCPNRDWPPRRFCWYPACWSLTDAVICYKARRRTTACGRLLRRRRLRLSGPSPQPSEMLRRVVIQPLWCRQPNPPGCTSGNVTHSATSQHFCSSCSLLCFGLQRRGGPTGSARFLLRYHPQQTSPVFRPLKVRATSKHMKGGRCGVIKHSTKLCLENMCLKSVD